MHKKFVKILIFKVLFGFSILAAEIVLPPMDLKFAEEVGWTYDVTIYSKPLRFNNWLLEPGQLKEEPEWYRSNLAKRRADQFSSFKEFKQYYSADLIEEAGITEAKFFEFVADPTRLYRQWGITVVTIYVLAELRNEART